MIALAAKNDEVRMRICSSREWPEFSKQWSYLREAAKASFFLSSEWIEVWLETFGEMLDTNILVFEMGALTVGAMLLSCSKRGIKVFPIRRFSLNAAGEAAADTTYTEYNSALCLPGWEKQVAESFSRYLKTLQWDELALDGFVDGTDVPLSATTSSAGATAFANSLVTAGTSETADPLVLGDAVLASSDTDDADTSI